MNAIRKILVPLLAIPLGMFVYVFTHPDWQWESPGLDLLFALIGVPILIANFIAWFYPELIKAYFPVKDDWGKSTSPVVKLAMVISALMAVTCVSAGMVSSATNVDARPTFRSSALQPGTRQPFTPSDQVYPGIADSSDSDTVPLARQLPKTATPAEPTAETPEPDSTLTQAQPTLQIPVSGGAATASPTLPFTQTQDAPASTRPSSISPAGSAAACTAASQDALDAIAQVVQDIEPDNGVDKGWAVQSVAGSNLWFVAAKVSGPEMIAGTPPGVWGLFIDSQGGIDIYAINATAVDFSDADTGADSEPALTMQTNGAQAAYDCAVRAQ